MTMTHDFSADARGITVGHFLESFGIPTDLIPSDVVSGLLSLVIQVRTVVGVVVVVVVQVLE